MIFSFFKLFKLLPPLIRRFLFIIIISLFIFGIKDIVHIFTNMANQSQTKKKITVIQELTIYKELIKILQ